MTKKPKMTLDGIYKIAKSRICGLNDNYLACAIESLKPYRDADAENRLFITEYGIGQHIFLIEYDEINDKYNISEQIVEDVSACGRVYSYDAEKDFPDRDDMLEPLTLEELDAFHVCLTRKDAEKMIEKLIENRKDV